jgi:hypothetical protein
MSSFDVRHLIVLAQKPMTWQQKLAPVAKSALRKNNQRQSVVNRIHSICRGGKKDSWMKRAECYLCASDSLGRGDSFRLREHARA